MSDTQFFSIKSKPAIIGKRGDTEVCNLCANLVKMSQAHVPPQGCIETPKRHKKAASYFFGQKEYDFQNGIHYFTLCKPCNQMLGSKFDNSLITFSRDISKKLALFPSYSWSIKCKPNRIAKSLIGCLLAASRGCVDNSWKELQNYVNCEKRLLPSALKVGFWLHPYENVRIIPQMCIIEPSLGATRVEFIMKYYPLSWIVFVQDETSHDFFERHQIHDFSQHLTNEIDAIASIQVYPLQQKHDFWPWLTDGITPLIGSNASDNALLTY